MRRYPTQQLLMGVWTLEMNYPAWPQAFCGVFGAVSNRTPGLPASASTMTNTEPSRTDQYRAVDSHSVSVPSDLSSDGTKLVYLYLQISGESTLDELNQSLEMKTISLLPILNTLQSKELVDRQDNYYLPTAT